MLEMAGGVLLAVLVLVLIWGIVKGLGRWRAMKARNARFEQEAERDREGQAKLMERVRKVTGSD